MLSCTFVCFEFRIFTLLMMCNLQDAARFSGNDECRFLNKIYGSMIHLQTLGVTSNE